MPAEREEMRKLLLVRFRSNVLLHSLVRPLVLLTVFMTPLSGIADSKVDVSAVDEGTLLVGLVVPSSGPERERGEAMRNGATLAVETINLSGGIHGARIALRVEESSGDAQSQLKAFSSLAGRPDLPVVISSGEDDGAVTQGVAEINQTLVLSNSMRSDVLKGGAYTIRIGRPVDGVQDGVTALMKERKLSKVSVLRGDPSWAEAAFANLVDSAPGMNVQVQATGKIWNTRGRPADEVLSKFLTLKPELLYLIAAGKEQELAVDAIRAGGITAPLVTISACNASQVADEIKKYPGATYSIDIAVDQSGSEYLQFAEKFAKRYPKLDKSLDTMLAYDAVYMVAAGYKAGAGTAVGMRDFMLKQRKFQGVAGEVLLRENGDSSRPVTVNTIQGGICRQLLTLPASVRKSEIN